MESTSTIHNRRGIDDKIVEGRAGLGWLIIPILLTLAAAATGAISQPGPWYQSLDKPVATPPSWVFGTVWPILYVLIAWAGILCYRRSETVPILPKLWTAQIILNGLWTLLFFGLKTPLWAMVDLALLVLVTLWLVIRAFSVKPLISVLLIPYLAWLFFAGGLNWAVLQMNPEENAPGSQQSRDF